MKVIIVLICLCVGVLPLLLLDGQTFTNALAALFFYLVAIVLCARFARDQRTPQGQKRAWRLATTLVALLALWILLTLPSAYRFQKRFNMTRRALHSGSALPR